MPTRAVLFDLGNTLVEYYHSDEFPLILRECLGCAGRAAGLSLGDSAEQDLVERALTLNRDRADHSVRPLDERLRELFQHHVDFDVVSIAELCQAFLLPIFMRAKLDRRAIPALVELRRRNFKTTIVSNTPWGSSAVVWREELARHGLFDKVDETVFCV